MGLVDRIGDWLAFARSCYYRRLTLYSDVVWGGTSSKPIGEPTVAGTDQHGEPNLRDTNVFSLATAEHVSIARFGGPVAALVRRSTNDVGTVSSFPAKASAPTAPRSRFNLSAHSAAIDLASHGGDKDKEIRVFTSAGELLATFPLNASVTRGEEIVALDWTPESELFFLLYPSLTAVFANTRDIAVDGDAAARASSISEGSGWISRRVEMRHGAAAAPVLPPPTARRLAALHTSSEGVLCVDSDGGADLYGLIHEERFTSSLISPIRLPTKLMPTSSPAVSSRLQGSEKSGAAVGEPRVTAVDMVPPAWNDAGEFVLLWSQYTESSGNHKDGRWACDFIESELCAMALPESEVLAGKNACGRVKCVNADSPSLSPPVERARCPGRVLELTVCAGDATRVAVFTSAGVLLVFRSNLSATLFAVDLGLCRIMRDAAVRAAFPFGGDGAGSVSFAFQEGASFGLGDIPWRPNAGDASGGTSFCSTGVLGGAASEGGPTAGSTAPPAGITTGSFKRTFDCPSPYKMEWCGTRCLLIHFYQADLPCNADAAGDPSGSLPPQRAEWPMFSLLVCVLPDCDVRCERLDWEGDGCGHIATVADNDGVRVMTDTTCYFVQEVPVCLAALCRVQPPYNAAAQVVQAYQAYAQGDRRGIALARTALASDYQQPRTHASPSEQLSAAGDEGMDASGEDEQVDEGEALCAESVVYELLDAASHEFDVEQQHRLVAAASFAAETIRQRGEVADVIVDVVRRLRVLRAIREEPGCHTPVTMMQYQFLTGNNDRPSRRLSRTEGQVLTDRLIYLGYYQLALHVVRGLHMKPTRVLSRWAASFIRRHASEMPDAVLLGELIRALKQYPDASYIEAATTAFFLNRKALALQLLRVEPQQQRRKVFLCLQMGELENACNAAVASDNADLMHFVLNAFVAHETCLQQTVVEAASSPEVPSAASPHVPQRLLTVIRKCLAVSPELLGSLLLGARGISSWRCMAEKLLVTHGSLVALECHWMLVQSFLQSSPWHYAHVIQCLEERRISAEAFGARGPPRSSSPAANKAVEGQGGETDGPDRHEGAAPGKHSAKTKRGRMTRFWKRRGSSHSSDSDVTDGEQPPSSVELTPLPQLSIPRPTAAAASVVVSLWLRRTKNALGHALRSAGELQHGNSSGAAPFSEIVRRAEKARFNRRKDLTSKGGTDQRGEATSSTTDRSGAIREARMGADEEALVQESYAQTILCPPLTSPSRDAAFLEKEMRLAKLRTSLAVKYHVPQLASDVVSVVDLLQKLCAIPEADGDMEEVRRTFKVEEPMFVYAQLRGLCAAQRWDAVDRLLGPPPPLGTVPFFSRSRIDFKAPCIGYLPAVELLASCMQKERAVRYVAGACSEAVDRVVWYMSLGAPFMALEAAMEDQDAGLIQQVMQRVPGNTNVQTAGMKMLAELRH